MFSATLVNKIQAAAAKSGGKVDAGLAMELAGRFVSSGLLDDAEELKKKHGKGVLSGTLRGLVEIVASELD